MIPPVTDEGIFQHLVRRRGNAPGVPPDPNGEIYLHEGLVTWDGWSLSAPRPGKSVEPVADASAPPERVRNEALTALGLEVEAVHRARIATPAAVRPRVRFRLRSVDLAGNGPTVAEADQRIGPGPADAAIPAAGATSVYRRFEPVAAPALVPRAPYDEGGSLLRLVIRSNIRSRRTTMWLPSMPRRSSPPTVIGLQRRDERHVAPPKTSLRAVEMHGLLDDVIGSDGQPRMPPAVRRSAPPTSWPDARRGRSSRRRTTLSATSTPRNSWSCRTYPTRSRRAPCSSVCRDTRRASPSSCSSTAARWDEAKRFRLRLAGGSGAPTWDSATGCSPSDSRRR